MLVRSLPRKNRKNWLVTVTYLKLFATRTSLVYDVSDRDCWDKIAAFIQGRVYDVSDTDCRDKIAAFIQGRVFRTFNC